MANFLYGLLGLMRPMEWSKSFGNMAIAAVTASFFMGVLLSEARFLIGFASVALLWSGLYTLNDYTDRKADAIHPDKKNRAIPAGMVSAKTALAFSILLISASLAIAFFAVKSTLFIACILAMLANQWLYTMKPWNFKKRPVLDMVSGSLVNPIFRFYAGWVLFIPAFNAPLQILAFILGVQLGGFCLYRMYSKEHEKKLGMKSSVVLFEEKNLKRISYAALAVGALSYVYSALTVLPIKYLFWGLAMLLAIPFYKNALKKPQDIEHKPMYRLTYLQYLVFIAGFVALYYLPL
jgi:4-hydroxybenzoate polyprenyltransferase